MEEVNIVKLHGIGANPHSKRVELALRIKGIPYEFIEEDLSNKSQLLLKSNPVYKKIPVLVHNEKPVVDSLIILEYIDETWKNAPQLLPDDPLERAKVRFRTSFIQQQLFEAMTRVVTCDGEIQAKAIDEVQGKMKVLEEGMKEVFPGSGSPSIDGDNLGLLDIMICSTFSPYKAYEEALGVKILDPERNPLVFCWVKALNELPLVKELYPPHDKLVALLKVVRENALKVSSST
ncbi:Glutathione S-transferase tau 9, putative [Theobroma cacao]|uniref:Glutathione S-transferase n=1 Tax=Theobroma cacao TaxID=3641 RepID=A0A061FY76_THECC|nr:Glutathione S-transferase tau 9, putative [Theobroma cacao]